jgi:hypothetical protein
MNDEEKKKLADQMTQKLMQMRKDAAIQDISLFIDTSPISRQASMERCVSYLWMGC